MQVITQFSGGLNASGAPNNIAENEVAAASNIDFSLQEGALVARRGSRILKSGLGTSTINTIYRNYNSPYDYGNSPWYMSGVGNVYRIAGTATTAILTSTNTGVTVTGFNSFDESTLIAYGGTYIKCNGTTVTDWIMQAPTAAPAITVSTQTAALVVTTSWSLDEGSAITTTSSTCTATGIAGGRLVILGTLTVTGTVTNTSLNTLGTATIGDYGVDYLDIAFDVPENVTKISRDYSIGDANFTNYFHTEYVPGDVDTVALTGDELVDAYQSLSNSSPTDIDTRERMLNELKLNLRVPAMTLPKSSDTFGLWAVARGDFDVVGKTVGAGWNNIGAIRYIIEYAADADLVVTMRNHQILGSADYPLTDVDVGYVWWETFATVDSNGVITNESAPSTLSTRVQCQHAQAAIVSTNTTTGTISGVTHRVYYRQGGYLRDAYYVGKIAIGTSGTATYTDTLGDIPVLQTGLKLIRNVYSKSTIPTSIQYVAQPHYSRVFVGERNNLMWSEPNKPGLFKLTNVSRVSQFGDEIQGLITWMPSLVIVNRDSIYELSGSIFDGASADWSLQRTAASRGSKAPKTVIRTPYGIPILDYDGLHLYSPGQGMEQKLEWLDAKIGDAWRGTATIDPATMSGSRVPAINKGYINNSFAIWANSSLYLGAPTGSATVPNTMFVINFATKRVWHYSYPFSMTCGWWDPVGNVICVGTPDGVVMEIETNNTDSTTGNIETAITWSVRTRTWTWPDEMRLTNLSIDNQHPTLVTVVRNSTSTETIATRTNNVRERYMPTMSGSLANNVYFNLSGTNGTNTNRVAVYELDWDAYPEPAKELYHRTEYFNPETEQEFQALHAELDCLGGTVTGTMKVDGSAVGTFTFTGTVGPQGYTKSLSSRTFGRVAYVEYYGTAPFRHYRSHYLSTPEPPRVTSFRTDYFVYDGEQEWKALAAQLDCLGGTVTAVAYVDSTAVSTHTFTGTGPTGYVAAIPNGTVNYPLNHVYGRSGYAIYSGSAVFKHYKSWFEVLPEPSRILHWRTPTKFTEQEQEYRNLKAELNCYAGTVSGVTYVDSTAIATNTFAGTGYRGFVVALPEKTYGRSIYTVYSGSSAFKHYNTDWDATPEPPRVLLARTQTFTWPTEHRLKTLVANLNPLGSVVTATIRSKNATIATATFTGTNQETFNYGLDVDSSLTRIAATDSVDVYYTSTGTFKHYDTNFDAEPTPFDKQTWQVTYRKAGGATQLDTPRFFSMDIEVYPSISYTTSTITTSLGTITATANNTASLGTITSIWDTDGVATATQTLTATGRQWLDRVSLPAGMRGYLFSQRLYCSVPIKVWRSNLDIIRTGIKGLSRTTISGVPNN